MDASNKNRGQRGSQKARPKVGAFESTAHYYSQYRVPYPDLMLADLRRRTGVSGNGWLLDLGTGTGRVALALAPYFEQVWAVDLEPEMVKVGSETAKQRGITNMHWEIGRAEEYKASPESFELVTIGEAFHRLDQSSVAKKILNWLRPGCCVALLGCFGILSGEEEWQAVLRDVVKRWKPSKVQPDRANPASVPRGAEHDMPVLEKAGFVDIENHAFLHPYEWTIDAIIGNLHSLSSYSGHQLGDQHEAFELEIKNALLAFDPRGIYPETVRFGYTVARRPRGQTSE